MVVNDPETLAELQEHYPRYEEALVTNDVETLTAMFNPLPAIALLPLALLWFGLGIPSLVFVIIHSVLWAVALNTHTGFLSVSETLRMVVSQPLVVTALTGKYDIRVNVQGGGPSGQAGAVRHSRAVVPNSSPTIPLPRGCRPP